MLLTRQSWFNSFTEQRLTSRRENCTYASHRGLKSERTRYEQDKDEVDRIDHHNGGNPASRDRSIGLSVVCCSALLDLRVHNEGGVDCLLSQHGPSDPECLLLVRYVQRSDERLLPSQADEVV